jgi:endoglucanase
VPLILGEYDASAENTEPAARWKYFDHLQHVAYDLKIATIMWDNGNDHLDRTTGEWRDPVTPQLVVGTTEETLNSLPDSTEDASATEQSSSAYIFHRVTDQVTAQTVPYLFNGNSLVSITDSAGTVLESGSDYSVSGANIVFSATYLATKYTSSTAPGVVDTLTLEFDGGASSPTIEIVQWDKPVLATTSAFASAVSGADLSISITWNGLSTVAAVKALTTSGVYLFDDWTQWLGPLQQARAVSTPFVFQNSPQISLIPEVRMTNVWLLYRLTATTITGAMTTSFLPLLLLTRSLRRVRRRCLRLSSIHVSLGV